MIRRDFLKVSALSCGTLLIPRWAFSEPQGDPHFFLQIYVAGGCDASYLFDGRPLAMTQAGLIQNYLGKEPDVWTGANGGATWASPLVQPLKPYFDRFSVVNGVLMSTSFDGHLQNLNDYFTGSAFGGDSFIPFLNGGSQATAIDAVQKGSIFTQVNNGGKIVQLAPESVSRLSGSLMKLPDLSGESELGQQIRARFSANGSGHGRFSGGSRNMLSGFDQMSSLKKKLSDLRSPDPNLSPEKQFVDYIAGIFRQSVARSAVLVLTARNFDTHDSASAAQQPEMFRDLVDRLAAVIRAMIETPFNDKKSLLDVTTFIFASEFSRTMRQESFPISNSGTDHNPLANSFIIGGKGIRNGQILGESDYRSGDETLSQAHLQHDSAKVKVMGRPFDFKTQRPRTDLPSSLVESDYINGANVINSVLDCFGVEKTKWRTLGRDKVLAPAISSLLA